MTSIELPLGEIQNSKPHFFFIAQILKTDDEDDEAGPFIQTLELHRIGDGKRKFRKCAGCLRPDRFAMD